MKLKLPFDDTSRVVRNLGRCPVSGAGSNEDHLHNSVAETLADLAIDTPLCSQALGGTALNPGRHVPQNVVVSCYPFTRLPTQDEGFLICLHAYRSE